MKYGEFKAEVEKLGFFVDMDNAPLYVDKAKGGETLIAIGKHKRFSVDPGWSGFHGLSENEQLAIYNLAHALAITPLAEREEEKRYYLRFIHPNILGAREPFYLHLHHSESAKDYYDMGTVKAPFGNKLQTIFTETEIAEMDITGFEKIEVTE